MERYLGYGQSVNATDEVLVSARAAGAENSRRFLGFDLHCCSLAPDPPPPPTELPEPLPAPEPVSLAAPPINVPAPQERPKFERPTVVGSLRISTKREE